MTARKGGRPWRRVREIVLKRDPECTIRGPRCTGISTTVDHIVPISLGGAELDPANLRGACGRCNYRGGQRITTAKRYGTSMPVAVSPYPAWMNAFAPAEREALLARPRVPACAWSKEHEVPCLADCDSWPIPVGCRRSSPLEW